MSSLTATSTTYSTQSVWPKIIDDADITSNAYINYFTYWKTHADRKIHDTPTVRGSFDVLLILPALRSPAQVILAAAAIFDRPELPDLPDAGATASVLGVQNANVKRFEYLESRYQAQKFQMDQLKEGMIQSLDHATLEILIPIRDNYLTITFDDLYRRIYDHFVAIKPEHLLAILSKLKEPFIMSSQTSYDVFVATHIQCNRVLVQVGHARTESEMSYDFRNGLLASTHAPLLSIFLNIYDSTHRTITAQSFTEMHQLCSSALPELITSLNATAASSQVAANIAATVPPTKKPPTSPRAPGNSPPGWCWTHGTMFHTSDKCRRPATGHQTKSTVSNKMGSTKQ
jgi:hypothetical protein